MESARLKINEHMTSVGEEILCVLDKQQRGVDDCCVELNVRVFVLERLSAAAAFMCNLFQREIETLHNTKLHTADVSSMTVQHMVVEPQKRGRGRPRKYPVCGGPVPSSLPEEERAGRDEEREDEMAGEDEERTGRQYDDDPTWHPDVSSMTVQHMVVEPQKRGRGRPRKYPVCGGPVPSSLPEEERAGRDEEREDEMAGEDEERKGRQYDDDPTWHPDVSSMTVQHRVVIQPKKRKPGRPRKHKCGGPVPSPLPEEERAGRDEERGDEMAGEDEERTGRRYDGDPTWHPDVSSMTVQHMVVEPQKRGRGRPRKYPVCLPSPALQCVVIQPKKRKPGRPRKHQCGGPVPSPLPEEERVGRDEEREDEMAGEDEERIGRRYDGDPTWHPDHHRERSRAPGEMASKRYLTLPEEQQEMDQGHGLLDARLKPVVELGRIDFLHLPVCKEEVVLEQQVRIQEESDPPLSKEKQEELLQRPEDSDDGSIMTLLEEESEDDDENRETEPVASTSTEHMKTQADAEDCGTSQPTADDQVSSHCSESDSEAIDEDWEETTEGHLALNTLKSQKTQNVEGQRLSLSKKLSQDPKSSKQTHLMRNHSGNKSSTCEVCGRECGHKSHLQQHMRVHTGEKPFTCMVCCKGFSQKSNLKVHIRRTHLLRNHTGKKSYTCEVCGKECGQKCNLQHHMRMHTGEKPFTCLVCSKGFSQKSSLKVHMRMHTGEKPFTCTVCSKGFSQKSCLKVHIRRTHLLSNHTGKKSYTCEVCGKECGQKCNLQHHMRMHTGEKPFTCTVCCKGFSMKGILQAHMRIHTGEKPFMCTVCGKSFSHTSTLRKHMIMHSETTSYICEVCGKGFKHIGCLKSHMITHTREKPFSCTVCGKDFSYSLSLKLHIRTHTGEKPYICRVCGISFIEKRTLQRHMLVHTGEKPFTCTFCPERFSQKANLKRHIKRKHTGGKHC